MIGCSSRTVPIIPDRNIYCNSPLKPTLLSLDGNDICTKENIQKLLTNLNDLINYTLGLESTIKCFEESLKKDGEIK